MQTTKISHYQAFSELKAIGLLLEGILISPNLSSMGFLPQYSGGGIRWDSNCRFRDNSVNFSKVISE